MWINQKLTDFFKQDSFSITALLFLIFEMAFFRLHYITYASHVYALFVSLLLVFGLLSSKLRLNPWYWTVFTASHFLWIYSRYSMCNNHDFLDGYIRLLLTLACFMRTSGKTDVLHRNASIILAVLFGFAVLNKWLSPDFLSGNFLLFQMHIDTRFLPAAYFLSENADKIIFENRKTLFALNFFGPSPPLDLTFFKSGLQLWMSVLSKLLFALELVVGVLFLVDTNRFLSRLKHIMLIFFCAVTYPVLPIVNFGLMISILGFASVKNHEVGLKKAYFFVMLWMVTIYYMSKYVDYLINGANFIVPS